MTAVDIRAHLVGLTAERLDAVEAGLAQNETYMSDLESAISRTLEAYTTVAVTEIATLRGQLFGIQEG